ncbi:MAG TPA: extracellular solute-binding protein, partial [Solirubrobacteraceae bacterium]|nr:extracellular solute-binding protein [Solirubrobacteraceae bacterium]
MPERPEELNILVPEARRAEVERMVTRRQAVLAGGGIAAAAYLAACGGSTSDSGGGGGGGSGEDEAAKPPTAADAPVEQGDLLLANWVDYTDPANYKAYAKEIGPKVKVSGFGSNEEILAKLRAGGSKFDVVAPSNNAVKTMADLGLLMPLTHELIPNIKNITPAFTQSEYDPGNKYSVPKDYGITSFYWLTDKVSASPTTHKEAFDLLKTPE